MQDKIDFSEENTIEEKVPVALHKVESHTLVEEEIVSPIQKKPSLTICDVLVFKKSPIETKIFTSVLSKMS